MIKRIDLFMTPRSRYGVLPDFTNSLADGLIRSGVNARVLEAHYDDPKLFLDTIFADPPDCTLSFNGLLPDDEGRFFCDMIRIPHVACLVDGPQHFIPLTRSPLSIITAVDRAACDFFQRVQFQNVLFMPHAVDKERILAATSLKKERPYDVLFLSSFIDYEDVQKTWRKDYPKSVVQALEEAAEATLSDRSTYYIQAFVEAFDRIVRNDPSINPSGLDFVTLLDLLEDYIRGRDRVQLVQSIQDVPIHIFGVDSHRWQRYMPKEVKIIPHESVTFDETFPLMRQSKVVLSSCPTILYGAHERVFAGLASGAVAFANENEYMLQTFKSRENIFLYRPDDLSQVNSGIHELLANPELRLEIAQNGRELVYEAHTWDHRAAVLINELTPILDRMRVT